jgi:hypothetical protein
MSLVFSFFLSNYILKKKIKFVAVIKQTISFRVLETVFHFKYLFQNVRFSSLICILLG